MKNPIPSWCILGWRCITTYFTWFQLVACVHSMENRCIFISKSLHYFILETRPVMIVWKLKYFPIYYFRFSLLFQTWKFQKSNSRLVIRKKKKISHHPFNKNWRKILLLSQKGTVMEFIILTKELVSDREPCADVRCCIKRRSINWFQNFFLMILKERAEHWFKGFLVPLDIKELWPCSCFCLISFQR